MPIGHKCTIISLKICKLKIKLILSKFPFKLTCAIYVSELKTGSNLCWWNLYYMDKPAKLTFLELEM